MGSGCSSPLKRFGGKRGKTARRESSPFENDFDDQNIGVGEGGGGRGGKNIAEGSEDNQGYQKKTCKKQPTSKQYQKPLLIDNEVTIQSEVNEDQPSSASYYTDGKNHNEETKISEHSNSNEPKSISAEQTPSMPGAAVARMIGLNGTYVPHDRHLLVSPALSPAPSTCYSPSPANSTFGSNSIVDLNDLNEAFKTLIFGLPNKQNRIKQPERQQSEFHNNYTQQLDQTQDDLINYISVIFITTDSFQLNAQQQQDTLKQQPSGNSNISFENLVEHIESNLKTFCDEHLFNLRLLNLNYEHLSEHFHINNLIDATMKIFEQVYQNNSQRTIIVVLSNNFDCSGGSSTETVTLDSSSGVSSSSSSISSSRQQQQQQQPIDKRQLPTKIEAQSMIKLQNEPNSIELSKELLKRWYNQVGDIFYLNPIYLVYPKILSGELEERNEAWKNWLSDSNSLIKSFEQVQESNPKLYSEIKLKTLFGSIIEFILKEPALPRRTLLIRNYSQPMTNTNLTTQQTSAFHHKDGNLNDLARVLPDPNKLTVKGSMNDDEFIKTINDWISENFNKFVESILENQISMEKHVPPFIERNLFTELTCQRHQLDYYLDNLSDNFEKKCQTFYSSQIIPILNSVICSANSNNTLTLDSTSTSDSLSPEIQASTNHLVFISGPKGCGKSTLFAQIVKSTVQDFLNKAQIIYRFCGVTLDSLSSNRLFRSICEQFCQTQGENITAASYIYSARREIMNALNKIIKQQASLIFLDGLDVFQKSSNSDLDWLYEIKANPRIRIFIMLETDSELYKKVLGSFLDATHISLDNPSISEWAQTLTSTARSRRFNSVSKLYDEIKKYAESDSKNFDLTYRDLIDIINTCRLRQFNNESIYPELSIKVIQSSPIRSLKNVHKTAILHLQYLLTPYQLGALFVAIDSSRNGLSESDIINIMTMVSRSPKMANKANYKFSSSLFNYLKLQLKPWLTTILCDKVVKIVIHRDFLQNAIDHYTKTLYPNIIQEVREILLEYFNVQAKLKSSKINLFEPRDSVSSAESTILATKASETTNLLILTNTTKAKEHILSKNQFFMQFLYGSVPEEFIEDFYKLKNASARKPSISEELQCLVSFIEQSIYPLRYSGSQIYSQIYCRAFEAIKEGKYSKSKKLNEIFNIASCPPIRNLLPISEASVNSFIKTRIGQQQPSNSLSVSSINAQAIANQKAVSTSKALFQSPQVQGKQKICTIKDNHRHVIVIYPDKGCISVWDIYEERAVRMINNLDQPKDLKMVDQRRAVVLCNRELRVYDLDSGNLLTKLKGVMNQKMPFFEVFGENYVVALARNRMYVNMLNLNTGELETTFKVGEDRFLNSLLVSANGGICVCGDETQKPFPLLVWNLNERRLLYDLRLERHEFITRMSAISDDGHFVVSVCRQLGDGEATSTLGSSTSSSGGHKSSPNFIVIYDLSSGTLFKKWKPGLDSCSVAISISANRSGKVINTIADSSILVWDLATGSKR